MHYPIQAAVAAFALLVPAAQASFVVTYQSTLGTLEFEIEGTLQGDSNTIHVSGINDFITIAGVDGPSLPSVLSYDDSASVPGGPRPAVITIDGSFLDLLACTDGACDTGIGFGAGNGVAGFFGSPFFVGIGAFETPGPQTFDSNDWSVAAAPVTATLPLLMIGALGLAAVRRRAG